MGEMQAVVPGFSGPQAAIKKRVRRLPPAARGVSARVPRELLHSERSYARTVRRRKRKAVASSATSLSMEQLLVQRATMGQSPAEMARIAELGYDGYLNYQLNYERIDDSELEGLIEAAFPSLSLDAADIFRQYRSDPGIPAFQLIAASLYRAIYSQRQLYERMVIFWTDHLNIHLFSDLSPFLKPVDDREVIRKHALGKFPDLLSASAHSAAMLIYLTNDSNVKGYPNENYARELMELHSLGVDNGYTQEDVREVARCFTGWMMAMSDGVYAGDFFFNAAQHDQRPKKVLGRKITAGGIRDGEQVLEILGRSRRTAEFISRKMLVYFWGYEPRKRDVKRIAAVYNRTGGDIKAMLRQILSKKRMKKATPKLKRPFHLITSAARALQADVGRPTQMLDALFQAGHLPFDWEPPDGYPDSESFWSGYILPRWNWAATFLGAGPAGGVSVDLPFIDPSLSPNRVMAAIKAQLFNGALSAGTEAGLLDFLKAGKLDKSRIHDAIGLAVASPDFQEY